MRQNTDSVAGKMPKQKPLTIYYLRLINESLCNLELLRVDHGQVLSVVNMQSTFYMAMLQVAATSLG